MIALSGSHHHHHIIHDSSIVIYRASIVICRLFIYSSFVDYVCLLFMVFVNMDDLIRCGARCGVLLSQSTVCVGGGGARYTGTVHDILNQ